MEAWIVAAILAAGAVYLWNRWRQLARIEFIRNYTFPHGLFAKLNAKRRSSIRSKCSSSHVRCASSFSHICAADAATSRCHPR
jgi:hypothetical protein